MISTANINIMLSISGQYLLLYYHLCITRSTYVLSLTSIAGCYAAFGENSNHERISREIPIYRGENISQIELLRTMYHPDTRKSQTPSNLRNIASYFTSSTLCNRHVYSLARGKSRSISGAAAPS